MQAASPITSCHPNKVTDAVVIDQKLFDILRKMDADPPVYGDVSDSESVTQLESTCIINSDSVRSDDLDDDEHCSDLPPPMPYFRRTPSLPSVYENTQERIHRSTSDTSLAQAPLRKNNLDKLLAKHMSKSLPNLRGCNRSIHNRGVGITILDSGNESNRDTGRNLALARVAEFDILLGGL
jgi:hypothetical protein